MPSAPSMLLPFEAALRMYGDREIDLSNDKVRAAFFACWAYANAELEAAVERERLRREPTEPHYRELDARFVNAFNAIGRWAGGRLTLGAPARVVQRAPPNDRPKFNCPCLVNAVCLQKPFRPRPSYATHLARLHQRKHRRTSVNRIKTSRLTFIHRKVTKGVSINDKPGLYFMTIGIDRAQVIGIDRELTDGDLDSLKAMGYRLAEFPCELPTAAPSGRTYTSYRFSVELGATMPDKITEYTWEMSRWEKLSFLAIAFMGIEALIRTVLREHSFSIESVLVAVFWVGLLGAMLFRVRVSFSYSTEEPIGKVNE